MNPSVSICNIVKNERYQIIGFLDSVCDFADEIIIIDTGSTDGTVGLIKQFISNNGSKNVKLLFLPSTDGFHYGIAKNFSIEQATSDYIIILDTDERPSEGFKKNIHKFLSEEAPLVASVVRKDEVLPHLIDYPERIIRRDSKIRYGAGNEYRVHEQLLHQEVAKNFTGVIFHQQRSNHYIVRPQRIMQQLELQIDRTPKTRSLLGHIIHGIWYFCYRFNKIFFKRKLYKDGVMGFKYAFMRSLDAFLIDLFVGLRPNDLEPWRQKRS